MTQMPPQHPVPGAALQPHRGTMILVLGILGIVVCVIPGIIAWVMGNTDLREMAAGQMDPTGEGLTRAGKICGIISVVLNLIVVVLWVLMLIIGFGLFAASAASGGGP